MVCTVTRKRTIRKKAKKFVVRDGVMYFLKKKRKEASLSNYTNVCIYQQNYRLLN